MRNRQNRHGWNQMTKGWLEALLGSGHSMPDGVPPLGMAHRLGFGLVRLSMTIVLVHSTATVIAQEHLVLVDTMRVIRPFGTLEEYTFPVVRTPDRPEVGDRVNQDLRIELLGTRCDSIPEICFSTVWGSLDEHGRLVTPVLQDLQWSVSRPFPRTLVVTFSAEGCGAYCDYFTTHRSYHLMLGTSWPWEQLFGRKELAAVKDSVAKYWRAKVQERIQDEEGRLEGPDLGQDEMALAKAALEMYRRCLEDRSGLSVPVSSYEPMKEFLRLHIERCSTHAERAIDELGQVVIDLPYSLLEPFTDKFFGPQSKW
jgi:hypothetical protein